jgi:hypothetical protein
MTRRLLFPGLMLAAAMVFTSVATAAPEQRGSFHGVFTFKAGELCDFPYRQVVTVKFTFKQLSNGNYIEHDQVFVSHTNQATGYTLREHDIQTFIFNDKQGIIRNVGVFWHLRNAAGKLVVVEAGQMKFDSNFNLIKVTPHLNPDFAAVICPALGGSPAS